MKKEKQEILDKIQKLLLLAKDQKGLPEGEAAKKMACRIMAKYRIEETEIDMETDNFLLDTYRYYADVMDIPQWVPRIIWMFCDTFNCKSITSIRFEYNDYEIIGTASDVETVKYFVTVVCTHIKKAGFSTWPMEKNWKKRQQLGNHAADIIWERLWEIKKEMETTIHEDENCFALVIKKDKEIAEAIKEMYPNLGKAKYRKTDYANDRKTREAGIKAGKTASLSFGITE